MNDPRPTILITGIAGHLGSRLLALLSDFRVVGVDLSPLPNRAEIELHPLDLGRESSCVRLVRLLRECKAEAVLHLAFEPESGHDRNANPERMWQANVAGVARIMEAISEVNRHGGNIRKFIHLSSAVVYGPETEPSVDESAPLAAHTLRSAMLKAETDNVVRFRAGSMGICSTYVLRAQTFAGASVESYKLNAIRGRAFGTGSYAQKLRRKKKLPLVLPMGKEYPKKLMQFVHVDDVARLLKWLLQRTPSDESELLLLNVAGSGAPISLSKCAQLAGTPMLRLPSVWLSTKVAKFLWKRAISEVPPDALPYMTGSCTTSTRQLRELLGNSYDEVIQYSSEAALRDSLREDTQVMAAQAD